MDHDLVETAKCLLPNVARNLHLVPGGSKLRNMAFGEYLYSAAYIGLLKIDEDFHDCGIMNLCKCGSVGF